jgi:hypothetical protein
MIPRIIHLNWLDEEPTPKVLETVEYWQANSEGREVVLHGDSLPLRESWRENYLLYAHNHPNKSDWMRWSSMLDSGGWYFDVDIRMAEGTSLDAIEARVAPDTCLVVPAVAGMRPLEANIICCPLNWQGSETVNSIMLAKHEHQPYYTYYTLGMVNLLYHAHPDWFSVGSARTLRNDRRNTQRQYQTLLRTNRRCGKS